MFSKHNPAPGRRALAGSLALVLGLALATGIQSAPKPKPGGRTVAVPIFKDGIRLFDQGYYQQALVKFKRAYFHFPSAKIHTRIALCYKWLGKYVQAISHYEKYLAQTQPKAAAKPPPATAKLRQDVQKTIGALLKKIGQIRLWVAAPKGALVRLNGGIVGKAPLKKLLRLTPGKYHVTVSAKDYHPLQRDLNLKAAQIATLKLKLKPIKKKVRSGGAAADDI
jgi:tetratricopeptide (TPR) repeat protein